MRLRQGKDCIDARERGHYCIKCGGDCAAAKKRFDDDACPERYNFRDGFEPCYTPLSEHRRKDMGESIAVTHESPHALWLTKEPKGGARG